jgi:hypothetical protein
VAVLNVASSVITTRRTTLPLTRSTSRHRMIVRYQPVTLAVSVLLCLRYVDHDDDRAALTVVHAKSRPQTAHVHVGTVAWRPGYSSSVGSATTADGFTGVTVSIADPSAAET